MRRSAAPSQLLKRAQQFQSPFVNPAAKRPCPAPQQDSNLQPHDVESPNASKVRSASDILSVINNSANRTNSGDNADESSAKNEDGNQSTEIKEASHSFLQDDQLSPLSETKPNILHHSSVSGSKNSLKNGRSFSVPTKQMSGPQREWNRPQASHGYPSLSRGTPGEENQAPAETRYYAVVWCKLSRKKHKNWEGDAVLIIKGRSVTLKDMEGKEIGRGSGYKLKDLGSLEEGSTLPVGGKEVEASCWS
ncbi:DNA repair and recombination protein RAD54B [Chionoecetes opilio]|uniref:DNA repair and recombination protein RAD54B n=1 Tax=Chionoecetes opilio TaxID=41210 RepID=A0A8J4XZ53_CHIOP|nr:DNA repair and recombination protein RAD54B [Chionoecetes opilio]